MSDRIMAQEAAVRQALLSALPKSAGGRAAPKSEPADPPAEAQRSAAAARLAEEQALTQEQSARLIAGLNDLFRIFGVEARYFIDPQTETLVVQLRDNETRKLIRQIPDEEFISRIAHTRELIGLLIDQRA